MTKKDHQSSSGLSAKHIQRPSAERLYADELERLLEDDAGRPRPEGWQLSPRAVVRFVLGDEKLGIREKFVGTRSFVERAVVSLATERGLMLIGEPGTAKSLLSELLAAAISGDSTLTIQGSAATTEDAIKYSWNYSLLLAEGPSERALVPAPLHLGMAAGKIVRFEEITRCPLEVQDALLSVLSDRVLQIPELDGEARTLYARRGFNLIATANTRDRGVNEMSAALKRRFNFETVHPIPDLAQEMALVKRQVDGLLERSGVPRHLPEDITEVLVQTFHELRESKSAEGRSLEALSSVMSTAEAVAVGFAAGLEAHFYRDSSVQPADLVHHLRGTAIKDETEDLAKLRHYLDQVVRGRRGLWKELYKARALLK